MCAFIRSLRTPFVCHLFIHSNIYVCASLSIHFLSWSEPGIKQSCPVHGMNGFKRCFADSPCYSAALCLFT